MKHTFLAAALVGIFALSAPYAYACFCLTPEVRQAFSDASAVFVGEVSEIAEPRTNDPKAPIADRLYAVTLKVEKSFKGVTFLREIVILSDQGRAGCFSWGLFLKGRKYLVYAEEGFGKRLAVLFSCNRTASLGNASKDLKQLGGWAFQFFRPPLRTQEFKILN